MRERSHNMYNDDEYLCRGRWLVYPMREPLRSIWWRNLYCTTTWRRRTLNYKNNSIRLTRNGSRRRRVRRKRSLRRSLWIRYQVIVHLVVSQNPTWFVTRRGTTMWNDTSFIMRRNYYCCSMRSLVSLPTGQLDPWRLRRSILTRDHTSRFSTTVCVRYATP